MATNPAEYRQREVDEELQTREEQGRQAESQMADKLTSYFNQEPQPGRQVEEVEDDEIVGDTPPKTKAGEIEEEEVKKRLTKKRLNRMKSLM